MMMNHTLGCEDLFKMRGLDLESVAYSLLDVLPMPFPDIISPALEAID